MFAKQHFSTKQAREFGEKFGNDWDWSRSNVEQSPMELEIEENGLNFPSAYMAGKPPSPRQNCPHSFQRVYRFRKTVRKIGA